MTKNFTFCPNLNSSKTLTENVNGKDFFTDLFVANWEILGFQIAFLVVTFVLIVPLTFCFIEVMRLFNCLMCLFKLIISRVIFIV